MSPRWISDGAVDRLREAAETPDLAGTKYELIGPLARGGMGAIYLARDTELDRRVALKVLSAPSPDPALSQRMVREARILARLEHPGIVPVHDAGVLPDGRIFYVMKHVRGRSLEEHPVLRAPLAGRLRVMEKICEAVAFAHDRGIVHRDLKPANVMVGEFGEVLVMDWGVAKILDAAERSEPPQDEAARFEDEASARHLESATTFPAAFTGHGSVLGTPAWMAPEQARGEVHRIDARADIYALGAILYFLLVGEPPSEARSPAEAIARFEGGATGSPRKKDPSVPKALDSICRKAMAQAPEARYALASDLGRDVALQLAGLRPRAHREGLLERAGRWERTYRTAILLVLAYLAMRVTLFLWLGR